MNGIFGIVIADLARTLTLPLYLSKRRFHSLGRPTVLGVKSRLGVNERLTFRPVIESSSSRIPIYRRELRIVRKLCR